MGKGPSFQQMVLGKWYIYIYAKKEVKPLPYTIKKNNPEWVKDLNVKPKTIQLFEENIEGEIHDIGFGNDFTNMTPKA